MGGGGAGLKSDWLSQLTAPCEEPGELKYDRTKTTNQVDTIWRITAFLRFTVEKMNIAFPGVLRTAEKAWLALAASAAGNHVLAQKKHSRFIKRPLSLFKWAPMSCLNGF